jgi:hypothetical protein
MIDAPDIAADKALFLDGLNHFRAVGLEGNAAAKAASLALRFDSRWSQQWLPPELPAVIPNATKSVYAFKDEETGNWNVEAVEGQDVRRELEARFHAAADAQFMADCINETGQMPADEAKAETRRAARARQHENSLIIARRLREGGTESFRASAEQLWKVGVHSGQWEPITLFRRICFIPDIAAAVRSDICGSTEFYLQKHTWCRMWVFTTGPRVFVDEVRNRLTALHGKLSDLNRELKERFGWQIILRCSELGTPELEEGEARRRREARKQKTSTADTIKKTAETFTYSTFSLEYSTHGAPRRELDAVEDEDDGRIIFEKNEPTYHPHAHVLVDGPRLSPAKFEAMKSFVREFMGEGHFRECGIIRKPREVCKYVTKESDMMRLTPVQLCDLERALFKVHMVQPMGALREQRRRRKNPECPMKLVRKTKKDGGFEWVERLDHNKKKLKFKGDEENAGVEMPANCCLLPTNGATGLHCSVIARLRPALGPVGVKEPRVLVRGNWKDVDGIGRHELVYKLWSETVEAYDYGVTLKAIKFGVREAQTATFNPFTEDGPDDGGTAAAVNAHMSTITGEACTMSFYDETHGIRRVEPPPCSWETAIPVFPAKTATPNT